MPASWAERSSSPVERLRCVLAQSASRGPGDAQRRRPKRDIDGQRDTASQFMSGNVRRMPRSRLEGQPQRAATISCKQRPRRTDAVAPVPRWSARPWLRRAQDGADDDSSPSRSNCKNVSYASRARVSSPSRYSVTLRPFRTASDRVASASERSAALGRRTHGFADHLMHRAATPRPGAQPDHGARSTPRCSGRCPSCCSGLLPRVPVNASIACEVEPSPFCVAFPSGPGSGDR